MKQELRTSPSEFVKLSHQLGANELLVQGAGGNTSFKVDDCMWIKASGTRLDQALEKNIFTQILHNTVVQNITNHPDDLLKDAIIGENKLRPSIETTLHAMMPHKVVLHTHPVDIIALAAQKKGNLVFAEYLKEFNWTWVPYAKPGIDLSMATKTAMNGKDVDILILGNHGLVVGGENCKEAENLTHKVIDICKQVTRDMAAFPKSYPKSIDGYFWEKDQNISTLATDMESFGICKQGVLYPDQTVFLGPNIPTVNEYIGVPQFISSYKASFGNEPKFIVVKGIGILIADKTKGSVREMLNCHAHVLRRIKANMALNVLSGDKIAELLNWDAEKYRQSLE